MSAIRDGRYPVTLDKPRHLYFSLAVLDEMQDRFGGFDKLADALNDGDAIKTLTWLFSRLLNEGAALTQYMDTGTLDGAEELTERVTGLIIGAHDINNLKSEIFRAFAMGTTGNAEPGEAEADGADADNAAEDLGNAESGRD
jgi:hypothetical protein